MYVLINTKSYTNIKVYPQLVTIHIVITNKLLEFYFVEIQTRANVRYTQVENLLSSFFRRTISLYRTRQKKFFAGENLVSVETSSRN